MEKHDGKRNEHYKGDLVFQSELSIWTRYINLKRVTVEAAAAHLVHLSIGIEVPFA